MVVSDPIADMLTRIRNALMAQHDSVMMPSSKMKLAIAKILKQEGYIAEYGIVSAKPQRQIKIRLKYDENNKSLITGIDRVSKPGLRVYSQKGDIPRVFGGLGIAVVSTSKGVMTGKQAYRQGIGGELICKVW